MGENDLWSFPWNFKSVPNNLPEVEKVCGSRFWVVADLSYISPSYGAVGLVVAEILTTPTRCRPMEMWMVVNDDSFFFVTSYPVSWTYPTDESRFTSPWWLLRLFFTLSFISTNSSFYSIYCKRIYYQPNFYLPSASTERNDKNLRQSVKVRDIVIWKILIVLGKIEQQKWQRKLRKCF